MAPRMAHNSFQNTNRNWSIATKGHKRLATKRHKKHKS
jgi:hypothetical protein